MEAVVFVGLQGSGKSSFFKERLFSSHVRISLDLLKTRHREGRFLATCLETGQRFVVDNTNPTVEERARYIALLLPVDGRGVFGAKQSTDGRGTRARPGDPSDGEEAANAERRRGVRPAVRRPAGRRKIRRRGVAR